MNERNQVSDPEMEQAVRRTVGIATLRRLHRMIEDEKQAAAADSRFVRVLGWICAVATVLTLAWMAFR